MICGCEHETHEHEHSHEHNHEHEHHHLHIDKNSLEPNNRNSAQTVIIEQAILEKNRIFALQNQEYLKKMNIVSLNFMSSPGSGKTSLLSKTVRDLKNQRAFSIIVGDQQTDNDARKLETPGVNVLQINTGKGCHLDAHGIGHGLQQLDLKSPGFLFIENVGNLVCPSLFDLGESYKIVILSVTEGEDKPEKYPYMFHCADVILITKIDLLPYIDFNLEQCTDSIRKVNQKAKIISVSSKTSDNLNDWYQWLLLQQTI